MEKIFRRKDHWGQYVIFVQKCKRYKFENQDKNKRRPKDLWKIMYTDLHK